MVDAGRIKLAVMSAGILLVSTTIDWPFPAQLAAAFTEVGAYVEALRPPRGLLARSRYPSRMHDYHPLTAMAALTGAIAAARPDMIVPCDDQAAELVDRAYDRPTLGRMEFLDAAEKCGAPATESTTLENADQLEEAMRVLGLPLVLKCDHSWGGEGVVIAATREEAREAFYRMNNPSRLRDAARALRGRGPHFLARALAPAPVRITA